MIWLHVVSFGYAQSTAAQSYDLPTAEIGEINGAPYRLEIPPNWNKGLVLYAHGYRVPGSKPPDYGAPPALAFRDVFLSRGFAFAESAYSSPGWAVKEGIEDTEALRRHFVRTHGKPSETYIAGHSMGGHITIAIIERYPEAYQGAMPMCGPLGAAVDFMNNGLFDMLVLFETLFPGTIGSPYEPGPQTAKKVEAAVAGELKVRAGGEPFDNRNRIYDGFGDDAALNRTVKRYAADQAAREYLRQYASPTGRIADPGLAIQTTSDGLVLGSDQAAYEVLTARAGTSDRFVVRFVEASGHCNFTPAQMGGAFDALVEWARTGKRPAAGEQK
jgi:pimeloyl-ACP methyl ester carboxylesterase